MTTTSRILRFCRFWLPVLLWLGVIALESFRLSSVVTGGWLRHLLGWLHLSLSGPQFETFHHILRKTGHFVGYGLLCLLLFRAWFHTLSSRKNQLQRFRLRCALAAIAGTLLTAVLDEWHQSFDSLRTSTPKDVVLDVSGGIAALLLAYVVFKMWGRDRDEGRDGSFITEPEREVHSL
ncbi:MAG TPA: VanZ family protein [Terriglobales bacterium]